MVFDSNSGINIGIGSEIYGNMLDDKKLPMSNYIASLGFQYEQSGGYMIFGASAVYNFELHT